MIRVHLVKQTACPVSAKKIKDAIALTLEDRGIVSAAEVAVAIVGGKTMADCAREYLGEEKDAAHPVLSFPTGETQKRFVFPPDGQIHLGEIVVSYPACVEIARHENRLVEEVVIEMTQHGALHLVGIHHD